MSEREQVRAVLTERYGFDPGDEAVEAVVGKLNVKTGRAPTGRLRNFKAMNDEKFLDVAESITVEGNDPEALAAVKAENERRFGSEDSLD